MHLSAVEVYDLVTEQLAILQRIATAEGAFLQHVKPHGALYNMSAKDAALANAIATAVYDFDASLLLFGLSGSYSKLPAKYLPTAVTRMMEASHPELLQMQCLQLMRKPYNRFYK
jgi:UPF0271 protein